MSAFIHGLNTTTTTTTGSSSTTGASERPSHLVFNSSAANVNCTGNTCANNNSVANSYPHNNNSHHNHHQINNSTSSSGSGNNNNDISGDEPVHQIVLMVPLMLPHMRLMLELCLGISCICLTMHLLVYGFVPKLRNTPGKCLMSLSLALLSGAVFFVLSLHIEPSPTSSLCISVAIIRLYSFLAAFFWMNVLAYDVYKTFTRALKFKISIIKLKAQENSKFLVYSLYGWLMPALIVSATLVLQINIPDDSPYNPSYGRVTCGISHIAPILMFFFIPVSIILTVNVGLFIVTAMKLKRCAEETRFATRSKAKVTVRLVLYMKLLTMLGVTWIFWFIALFTQTPVFTYPTIVLHGLNGAFIFVSFTVKRNVYRLIVYRIKYLRGHRHIGTAIKRFNNHRPAVKSVSGVGVGVGGDKSETQFSLFNDPFKDRFSSV
ncbi:probable G-protein coupled receptor Mth-like 3 [Oppia nitens]|uniref:probable G-protein coupled receptor Mth-like 3 n=1 Tax=Oppia nitens TaxID=1686743 RepID=UPI0023DC8DF5|nr:probable G-protein coupled receptor Mth-like 3 [Oppia nitens]